MSAGKDDAEVGFDGIGAQGEEGAELCDGGRLGDGEWEDCTLSSVKWSRAQVGIHILSPVMFLTKICMVAAATSASAEDVEETEEMEEMLFERMLGE